LLVGKTKLTVRSPAHKTAKLNDEAVVEPELLSQPFAVGHARVLADHAVDRIADIIEQRKGDQRHGEHYENGLRQAPNDKRDHRSSAARLSQLDIAQLKIVIAHRRQLDVVAAGPNHYLLVERDAGKILLQNPQTFGNQFVAFL